MNKLEMKKVIHIVFAITLILYSGLVCHAKSKKTNPQDKRTSKLESLINNELKMLQSLKDPGPKALHRIFELYIEKINVISEKENKIFLEQSIKTGKTDKKHYFHQSRKMYKEAHSFALKIFQNNPKYRYNAEIFYALAILSRDYDQNKFTESYLLKAKELPHDADLDHKIHLLLAEYYYNEKKFSQATLYFDKVKLNEKDSWKSKHLFNNAWCLYQVKKYNEALNELMLSFKYSETKGFININDQILKASTVFFISANKIDQGIRFFLQHSPAPQEHLLKMAERTSKDGHYVQTKTIIESVRRYLVLSKKKDEFIDLYDFELDTYKQFKEYDLFFKTSAKIKKEFSNYYLIDQKTKMKKKFEVPQSIIDKIEERTNFLQLYLAKIHNDNKTNLKTMTHYYKRISSYFLILKSINDKKSCEYHYRHGENHFLMNQFTYALKQYHSSLKICEERREQDYLKKSVTSILGTIPKSKETNINQQNYLYILSYSTYLKHWPKGEFAESFNAQLFKVYIGKKDITNSTSTFKRYFDNYRSGREKAIKDMINAILDLHVAKKQSRKVNDWLEFIRDNKVAYNKDEINNIISILGGLLFANLQKKQDPKEKDAVVKSYEEIYNDPKFPTTIKAQASLLLAFTHLKANETTLFKNWIVTFIKIAPNGEYERNRDQILMALNDLYLQSNFANMTPIILTLIEKRCSQLLPENKKNILDYHFDSMMLTDSLSMNSYLNFTKDCSFTKDQITSHMDQIYYYHINKKDFNSAFEDLKQIMPKNVTPYTLNLLGDFWNFYAIESKDKVQDIRTFLIKVSEHFKEEIITDEMSDIDLFDTYSSKITQLKEKSWLIPMDNFDEKQFNQNLEAMLSSLAQFTEEFERVISNKHPIVVIRLMKRCEEIYLKAANEIDDYRINGMPDEYVKGFKGAMKELIGNLGQKARSYQSTARTIAAKAGLSYIFEQEWDNIDIKACKRIQDAGMSIGMITMDKIPSSSVGGNR